jgi:hypothetical protein
MGVGVDGSSVSDNTKINSPALKKSQFGFMDLHTNFT